MMETTHALGSPPDVRNPKYGGENMAELSLTIVFLAFLIVIVALVGDDKELARSAIKGLSEAMQKALFLFKG